MPLGAGRPAPVCVWVVVPRGPPAGRGSCPGVGSDVACVRRWPTTQPTLKRRELLGGREGEGFHRRRQSWCLTLTSIPRPGDGRRRAQTDALSFGRVETLGSERGARRRGWTGGPRTPVGGSEAEREGVGERLMLRPSQVASAARGRVLRADRASRCAGRTRCTPAEEKESQNRQLHESRSGPALRVDDVEWDDFQGRPHDPGPRPRSPLFRSRTNQRRRSFRFGRLAWGSGSTPGSVLLGGRVCGSRGRAEGGWCVDGKISDPCVEPEEGRGGGDLSSVMTGSPGTWRCRPSRRSVEDPQTSDLSSVMAGSPRRSGPDGARDDPDWVPVIDKGPSRGVADRRVFVPEGLWSYDPHPVSEPRTVGFVGGGCGWSRVGRSRTRLGVLSLDVEGPPHPCPEISRCGRVGG